jgi:hypothetical protein
MQQVFAESVKQIGYVGTEKIMRDHCFLIWFNQQIEIFDQLFVACPLQSNHEQRALQV